MAASVPLIVESRLRGRWRVRLVVALRWALPGRARLAAARWAVRRATIDIRTQGARWRSYHPHFDIQRTGGVVDRSKAYRISES